MDVAMAQTIMNRLSCDAIETDHEERVAERFRRQTFSCLIGAEMLRVLPGFCSVQLPYRENMACRPGRFHAGVVGALAVGAGECAALSLLPLDTSLAATGHTLNVLAPAEGDVLVANAKVIKSSETMTVCMAEMYACRDQSRNLCAVALMTFVPG